MFERFVAFLDSIGGGSGVSEEESTPLQLASAAILFAVMDADGVRHGQELAALREIISERFDLEGEALPMQKLPRQRPWISTVLPACWCA
jgi:uncharacterized tellurite resistance protein B-like protein